MEREKKKDTELYLCHDYYKAGKPVSVLGRSAASAGEMKIAARGAQGLEGGRNAPQPRSPLAAGSSRELIFVKSQRVTAGSGCLYGPLGGGPGRASQTEPRFSAVLAPERRCCGLPNLHRSACRFALSFRWQTEHFGVFFHDHNSNYLFKSVE